LFFAATALLSFSLLLAACGGAAVTTEATIESASGGTVRGNVLYLDRSALDPAAVIEVDLVQSSGGAPNAVIATQSINAEGRQVPIPFELAYDPAQIDPTQSYQVVARILVGGQLAYASQAGVPVITHGAPVENVEVLVGPVTAGPSGGLLTGTVTYLERVALTPEAVITVELHDASAGTMNVIASTQQMAEGRQVPIPFELTYDPAAIDPAGTYLLSAFVEEGGFTTFATQTGVPVLTNNALTSNVELVLSAAASSSAPAPGGAIRGTVTTPRPPEALDPTAVLQVELREPNLADAPATSTVEIPLAGLNFPVSFELPYDAATIAADRPYVVAARVVAGNRLHYVSLAPAPVLTGGAPASEITVPVAAVPDPAGGVLRFTVTSESPMTWAPDSAAYLNVEIREPNLADAPATAFAHIPLAGLSFPVAFELGYDAAAIDPNKAYIFDARIIDNNTLTHQSAGGTPVLTQGAPTNDVTLAMTPLISDAPPGNFITGVITTDAPIPLDPAAAYFVDLREAGSTGDPLVTISATLEGAQFPVPFEVPYDPAVIDPNKDYVVGARILMGEQVLYASQVGVPVLTKGAPTTQVTVNIPPQQ
jgi:uncharacterized lipoprotein YbaY